MAREFLVTREIMEQAVKTAADREIHNPEIKCEQEHCDDDHSGRRLHFLARRGVDLPHFGAHIGVETLDALRPGLDLVSEIAAGCCERTRHPFPLDLLWLDLLCLYSHHSLPDHIPPQKLAGAEG